jgi:hypothetical protein
MSRAGVVLLSADPRAKAFVDDALNEMVPHERGAICVATARDCLAVLSVPVPRRLLIIDGAPPDLGPGSLVEAAQIVDPGLPILFVRSAPGGLARMRRRVRIQPGPLVSAGGAVALTALLGRS